MGQKKGCLGFLFGGKGNNGAELEGLPYRLQKDFLSPAELTFYKVMHLAVGDAFAICPKVKLADIFYVANQNDNYGLVNKIARKHIDFLLCDIATMKPLLGVELDDKSHDRKSRLERDFFVEDVFEAARFPLARVFVQPSYNPNDLREYLFEAAGREEEVLGERKAKEEKLPPQVSALTRARENAPDEISPAASQSLEQQPALEGSVPGRETAAALSDYGAANPPGEGSAVDREGSEPLVRQIEGNSALETAAAELTDGATAEAAGSTAAARSDAARRLESLLQEDLPPDTTGGFADPSGQKEGNLVYRTARAGLTAEEIVKSIQETAASAESSGSTVCPLCQVPMVLRTSKRGTQFYSCANFPRCRYVRGVLE